MKNRKIKILIAAAAAVIVLTAAAIFIHTKQAKPLEINTLVIPSRNYIRMQPQIYYAAKDASKEADVPLKMWFVVFNPFKYEYMGNTEEKQEELLGLLYKCVDEVVAVKKADPGTDQLLKDIHLYVKSNPGSYLAQTHKEIEDFMKGYEFLIIESSDTYGVHPMFYKPGVTDIKTKDGADEKDIIEALYGLFFIDAAFKENKPVWGTCHGSQVGYIHAGGKLDRLFRYKEGGYDYIEYKKKAPKYTDEEVWRIDTHLHTSERKNKSIAYEKYGLTVYPVPEIYKDEDQKGREMYMNKDFDHSLGLVEPLPEKIEIISYHPLSKYKDQFTEDEYAEVNEQFKQILKNQVIVDAYKYGSMLGTQYHPQYTYDDLDTSVVFDYLIDRIVERYENGGSE